MTTDPFDLERFVTAQAPVYERVLAELAAGRKETHWMWFVFPQMRGLGRSATAHRYGISSLAQAAAYLAHPVLGRRLIAATRLIDAIEGRSAREIFGTPDDLKLRSSLTLFAAVAGAPPELARALAKYFPAGPDQATLALIDRPQPPPGPSDA